MRACIYFGVFNYNHIHSQYIYPYMMGTIVGVAIRRTCTLFKQPHRLDNHVNVG